MKEPAARAVRTRWRAFARRALIVAGSVVLALCFLSVALDTPGSQRAFADVVTRTFVLNSFNQPSNLCSRPSFGPVSVPFSADAPRSAEVGDRVTITIPSVSRGLFTNDPLAGPILTNTRVIWSYSLDATAGDVAFDPASVRVAGDALADSAAVAEQASATVNVLTIDIPGIRAFSIVTAPVTVDILVPSVPGSFTLRAAGWDDEFVTALGSSGFSCSSVGPPNDLTTTQASEPTTTTMTSTTTTTLPTTPTTTIHQQTAPKTGYWMLGANGHVYPFGDAATLGNAPAPASAIAARRDGHGYWTTDTMGRVRAFGTAQTHGGRPPLAVGERVTTIAATPSGNGYWLFTNRGRVHAYGDAHSQGDLSRIHLNGGIVASSATATGRGYYMIGTDGGVFAFGDARFHGSTGHKLLNKPVVDMSPTPDDRGYWLVAADGGVFAFGNATFHGSMANVPLRQPINGLAAYGHGYLMVASDGGVFDFSDKAFLGSLGNNPPATPIVGIAAFTT